MTTDSLDTRFSTNKSRSLLVLEGSALGKVIHGFAVDSSGDRVAIFAPTPQDLTIVDVPSGKILFQGAVAGLSPSTSHEAAISFSDDGSTLYWATGGTRLVCFDMKSFAVSGTYEVGAFRCQSMCVDRNSAYFAAPDFFVIKVDLSNGNRSEITFPEGISDVFRGRDGVFGWSPNFHQPKGQMPQPKDGLPLFANRPVKLISLSSTTFGEHLTFPPAAGGSFFIQMPDGRWAMASESDPSGIDAAGKSQLIIADAAGKKIMSRAFARGSLGLTGFAFAGGRLFISSEDASEPVWEFTTDGDLKASTFIHQDRFGPVEMHGAGDKLFVATLYEVRVFG